MIGLLTLILLILLIFHSSSLHIQFLNNFSHIFRIITLKINLFTESNSKPSAKTIKYVAIRLLLSTYFTIEFLQFVLLQTNSTLNYAAYLLRLECFALITTQDKIVRHPESSILIHFFPTQFSFLKNKTRFISYRNNYNPKPS